MVTKSLPTFKHTSVGAKTHKARTATAHVSYIMRSEAMTEFQAENMPDGGRGTRVFFDKLWEKAGMPDNARIADKLMIALPVELNREQRYEAVRSFMTSSDKAASPGARRITTAARTRIIRMRISSSRTPISIPAER